MLISDSGPDQAWWFVFVLKVITVKQGLQLANEEKKEASAETLNECISYLRGGNATMWSKGLTGAFKARTTRFVNPLPCPNKILTTFKILVF